MQKRQAPQLVVEAAMAQFHRPFLGLLAVAVGMWHEVDYP